jgi:hypothetical protein
LFWHLFPHRLILSGFCTPQDEILRFSSCFQTLFASLLFIAAQRITDVADRRSVVPTAEPIITQNRAAYSGAGLAQAVR